MYRRRFHIKSRSTLRSAMTGDNTTFLCGAPLVLQLLNPIRMADHAHSSRGPGLGYETFKRKKNTEISIILNQTLLCTLVVLRQFSHLITSRNTLHTGRHLSTSMQKEKLYDAPSSHLSLSHTHILSYQQ